MVYPLVGNLCITIIENLLPLTFTKQWGRQIEPFTTHIDLLPFMTSHSFFSNFRISIPIFFFKINFRALFNCWHWTVTRIQKNCCIEWLWRGSQSSLKQGAHHGFHSWPIRARIQPLWHQETKWCGRRHCKKKNGELSCNIIYILTILSENITSPLSTVYFLRLVSHHWKIHFEILGCKNLIFM